MKINPNGNMHQGAYEHRERAVAESKNKCNIHPIIVEYTLQALQDVRLAGIGGGLCTVVVFNSGIASREGILVVIFGNRLFIQCEFELSFRVDAEAKYFLPGHRGPYTTE
jgi:hypothetical protein